MKKIDWKSLEIKPHNIIVAYTSPPDYEMSRYILLENGFFSYIVLEGSHCSCFDFDDTEWEAIEYNEDELRIIANADYNKGDEFWEQVKIHI